MLFRAGDRGDRMYYVAAGTIVLREPGVTLEPGAILGEISLFSSANRRGATAVCDSDCDLYTVTQDVVLQLFYQRPEFGFFLIRLVTARLQGEVVATPSQPTSLPPADAPAASFLTDRLEPQARLAQRDEVVVDEVMAVDATVVDVAAVRRSAVDKREAVRRRRDLAVVRAHEAVVDRDVAAVPRRYRSGSRRYAAGTSGTRRGR